MKFYSLILLEIHFHTKKNDTVIVQNCKKKYKTCASIMLLIKVASKWGQLQAIYYPRINTAPNFRLSYSEKYILYIYFNPFYIMHISIYIHTQTLALMYCRLNLNSSTNTNCLKFSWFMPLGLQYYLPGSLFPPNNTVKSPIRNICGLSRPLPFLGSSV